MGWLQRANEWIRQPFRSGATAAGASVVESAAANDRAPALPPAPRPPAETQVTLRYLFGLTNPGHVKPPGDGAERVDDADSARFADLTLLHFLANRPVPSSFPAMAAQVIDLAEQPEVDLTRLSRLIERDAAMSATVLQVASAALYHREFEIASLKQAIDHLGLFAVANIAVGVACRSLYDAGTRAELELYPKLFEGLFQQAMTVAYAASQFCADHHVGRSDQVFLAGMFHDVGKALALRSLCSLHAEGTVPRLDEVQVERVLERVHVRVGGEAHDAWQLPEFLATICRRHHDGDVVPSPDYDELHVIRIVSGMNALRIKGTFDRPLSRQVRTSVQALGLAAPELKALTSSIRESSERVTQLFSLAG